MSSEVVQMIIKENIFDIVWRYHDFANQRVKGFSYHETGFGIENGGIWVCCSWRKDRASLPVTIVRRIINRKRSWRAFRCKNNPSIPAVEMYGIEYIPSGCE